MGLSYSTDKTDETGKELLTYGTPDFPIAFFDDDLTKVKIPWHWHDELELAVILSGETNVFIAGCEIYLKAKEILSLAENAWLFGANEKTDYAITVRFALSRIFL